MARPAFDVPGFPTVSATGGRKSFTAVFPIGTGGLPVHAIGTGAGVGASGAPNSFGTGFLPIATGSLNGVPSGVPLFLRTPADMNLVRTGTGLYRLVFNPAPNGTIHIWQELAVTTTAPRIFTPTKRDMGTGYIEFTSFSGTGGASDLQNGEAIGVEYVALTTGEPGGS